MKRTLIVFFVLFVAVLCLSTESRPSSWLGWDMILFGWPHFSESGQLIRVEGVSALLGYASRNFFEPVQVNQINFFWEFGVHSLLLGVHGGLGLVYPIPFQYETLYLIGSITGIWGLTTMFLPIFPIPSFGIALVF